MTRASPWGGSILFDEEERLFKLWYHGDDGCRTFSAIGYAESRDGILWHKPKLGLHEYGGRTDNNIVFRPLNAAGAPMNPNHFVVAKDPREPDPARRYKGWARGDAACHPVYSPDGIQWRWNPTPVAWPRVDPVNMIVDDADPDPARRIKVYGDINCDTSESFRIGHRNMGFGPDIEHCAPSPANPVIEPAGLEHTIHLFATARYAGYYVALLNYSLWLDYLGYKGDVRFRANDSRMTEPKTGAFVGDIRLAVNRDGIGKFHRVNAHQPLVARGEQGQWDSGSLEATPPILVGDTIHIFYSGVDIQSGFAYPNGECQTNTCMGLATLRRDGFTHLQTRDGLTPAHVTTVPIAVRDPHAVTLIVNASDLMPYRDWIEAEILDAASGAPLPGFTRAECTDLTREGIRLPVEWGERRTLAGIGVPAIRLRFHLFGRARLYSFSFADEVDFRGSSRRAVKSS